ncbi:hypothetical protein [Streptomyces sp. NPDC005374]|uniref:hypothetical protein n=1 Tax=Streptomyces sp. NPDC005374 TaxID=3364713 RepID=UPI0036AEE4FE
MAGLMVTQLITQFALPSEPGFAGAPVPLWQLWFGCFIDAGAAAVETGPSATRQTNRGFGATSHAAGNGDLTAARFD